MITKEQIIHIIKNNTENYGRVNLEDAANEILSLLQPAVSGSYAYVITFYDYDHDIIKHIFNNEQYAINAHKKLQEERAWGFYNLHKIEVE